VPQLRDAPERGGSGGGVDQGLHDFGAPLVIENKPRFSMSKPKFARSLISGTTARR